MASPDIELNVEAGTSPHPQSSPFAFGVSVTDRWQYVQHLCRLQGSLRTVSCCLSRIVPSSSVLSLFAPPSHNMAYGPNKIPVALTSCRQLASTQNSQATPFFFSWLRLRPMGKQIIHVWASSVENNHDQTRQVWGHHLGWGVWLFCVPWRVWIFEIINSSKFWKGAKQANYSRPRRYQLKE